jgi:coenzyme Q-binding protein COQ10
MPVLESEVFVNAPREIVYAVAKDVNAFPTFMPDVESITILERSEDGSPTLTKWVGLVPEFHQKIRWTEADRWDNAAFLCEFHQTEGEYQVYEGEWRFLEGDGGTRLRSVVRYELEIPLIGALLKNIVAKKMRDNTDKILAAIKDRAEQQAAGR